jgi:hypothetical protein
MRNGTMGQLGKYAWAALAGAVYGLAGGAVYGAAWGLVHWTVSGKGLSSASGPWLLALGAALGLLAGLGWAAGGLGQPQRPSEAEGRRPVPEALGGVNRITDAAVLRRLRG